MVHEDQLSPALERLNQALADSTDRWQRRQMTLEELRAHVAPPLAEFIKAASRSRDSESVVALVRGLALGAGLTDPRDLQLVDELIAGELRS